MGFAGEQSNQYADMPLSDQALLYLRADGQTRSTLVFGILQVHAIREECTADVTASSAGQIVDRAKRDHTIALGITARTELAALLFGSGVFENFDQAEQRIILARYIFGIAHAPTLYDSVGPPN